MAENKGKSWADMSPDEKADFVRQAEPILLSVINVTLDTGHAAALAKRGGVLFKLDPDTQTYIGHADERLPDLG